MQQSTDYPPRMALVAPGEAAGTTGPNGPTGAGMERLGIGHGNGHGRSRHNGGLGVRVLIR